MLIESSTCDIYTTQPAGQASSFSNKTLLAPSPTSTQNTLNDPFFVAVCAAMNTSGGQLFTLSNQVLPG